MSSTNQIAVVTGANKGLGFEIVRGLCEKLNGIVYLTSRDEKRGVNACEELKKSGLNPYFYQLDVTDKESIEKFCSYIQKEHGQIDILINNAGVLFLKDSPEPKIFQAEQTLSVNFFALVNFTEAILPLVRNGGRIINISSSSGHLSRIPSEELRNELKSEALTIADLKCLMDKYVMAVKNDSKENVWGDSPYVVSKVGVNAYTFMLQRRLAGRDIVVNCVHPGYVISDMTRGAGDVTTRQGARYPLQLALEENPVGGRYMWHDGSVVPWDGADPRGYIDGKQ